jgi:hypothetical protein
MIRDRARLDALLAAVRGFVREVAIPNEDHGAELNIAKLLKGGS